MLVIFILMKEWTKGDQALLISLAQKQLSIEEMRGHFPKLSDGTIAAELVALKRQKLLPPEYKYRMTNWSETTLIDLASKGLTAADISQQMPGTTTNIIIGRLNALRNEKKLPSDFVVKTGYLTKDPIRTGLGFKKDLADEYLIVKERHTSESETATDYSQIIFEIIDRISKIESEVVKKPGSFSGGFSGKETEYPEISNFSSQIAELNNKIEQLTNRELSAILNKISNMERKISALEIILNDYKHQTNVQKSFWISVRQAAELHESSELIKILQDAETLAEKKKMNF